MKRIRLTVIMVLILLTGLSSCGAGLKIEKRPGRIVKSLMPEGVKLTDFGIKITKNVLALEEQAEISLDIQKDIKYELKIGTEYGSVRNMDGKAIYTAPRSMPSGCVDTVTALVTCENHTIKKDTYVLVLDKQLAGQWMRTGGPQGGTISVIEVDTKNKGVMYSAGSGSRLFKSVDNGDSWRGLKIDDESVSGMFYDIKIDPGNPDVIYAIYNDRLMISRDAGENWEYRIGSNSLGDSILDIDINKDYPGILLAAVRNGQVLLSRDCGKSFTSITGNLPKGYVNKCLFVSDSEFWVGVRDDGKGRIYKTTNSGKSWSMVNLQYPLNAGPRSLYVDPDDHQTVYISMVDFENRMIDMSIVQLYLQKTTDGGLTWEQFRLPFADAMICVLGKSESGALYVSTGGTVYKSKDGGSSWERVVSSSVNGDIIDIGLNIDNPECIFLPTARSGIIKSMDGGATWELKVQGLDNLKTSLLATPLKEQGQTLYVSSVGGEGIFKTQDFGRTWERIIKDTIHPWGDELQVNPVNPDEIWYIADVGNVYVTKDGGETWGQKFDPRNQGLRFGSVYALTSAPSDSGVMYAVKNGFGLFKTENGGKQWKFLNQSEVDYTYTIAVDPKNPNIVYSGYNPKPFQDFAMVRKSEDGGETWETKLKLDGSKGITSVAINPSNPRTVYAGSIGDDPGLWYSTNGGDNWEKLCKKLTFTNVHTMCADPKNPNVAYAGVWGGGTYKTEDKGKSWTRLVNDPTDSAIAILIDGKKDNVVYLADRTAPKIYKSDDGGKAWKTYFDAGQGYYRVMAADISQSDPSVIYASVLKNGSPFEGTLYRIEDGKAVPVSEGLKRLPVSIGIDPKDSNHVIVVSHAGEVFESRDGGDAWASVSGSSKGLPDPSQASYNKVLFDPDDSSTIYLLGGGDVVTAALEPSGISTDMVNTVYRSTDGGRNWENLNDGNLGKNSGSVKGICFSKDDPNIIYIGCTNGIFKSTDNGKAWQDASGTIDCRNTAGLTMSSDGENVYAPMLGEGVYAGSVGKSTIEWQSQSTLKVPIQHIQVLPDPKHPNTIYASAYPGGIFKSVDGGKTFTEQNFGLPSFKVADPIRQGYYAISLSPSNPDVIYLGIYGKGVYMSKDGAGTWIAVNGSDGIMRSKGIYSLIVDPDDPDVAVAAAEEGIYKTENGGTTWSPDSAGLPDNIQTRVLSYGSDGKLYAGTLGYEIYTYETDTSSWRQLNAFGQFGVFWPIWNDRPLYQYSYLLFNKNDQNKIIIGTFPAGIYKSTDGGATFQESNVNWTFDGVFYLTYHPYNDQIIYAGTYNGVNISLDQGKTWEQWDRGWPDQQWVFSIDFDMNNPNIMYACSKNGENEGQGTDEFGGTVMKSTDGGLSWFPITNGLDTSQEFYKIIVDRHDTSILYLATEREGVYISRDAGASWNPWNDGLTNKVAGVNSNNVTNTMVLSPDGNLIYFGTSGDGVFRRVTETLSKEWGK